MFVLSFERGSSCPYKNTLTKVLQFRTTILLIINGLRKFDKGSSEKKANFFGSRSGRAGTTKSSGSKPNDSPLLVRGWRGMGICACLRLRVLVRPNFPNASSKVREGSSLHARFRAVAVFAARL